MPDHPASTPVRLGALLWLLLPLTVVAEVVAAAAWPGYDPFALTISDLGATTCATLDYPAGPVDVCSPRHALVNASFVAGGLALGTGALLLRPTLGTGGSATAALVLFLLAGASWGAAGVVPVDADLTLHAALAFPAFCAQSAALVVLGRSRDRFGFGTLRVGLLTLLATIATLVFASSGYLGGLERLAQYPVLAWLAWHGVRTLRASADA